MKKLLCGLFLGVLLFVSCLTVWDDGIYGYNNVHSYEYVYYDYAYNYPVVLVGNVYNYRIWKETAWIYVEVPRDRYHFIRHYDTYHTYHSSMRPPRDIIVIRDNYRNPPPKPNYDERYRYNNERYRGGTRYNSRETDRNRYGNRNEQTRTEPQRETTRSRGNINRNTDTNTFRNSGTNNSRTNVRGGRR